ncbi:hypothetical protein HPB47_013674 [Ixodes persulcatus]|uniref:Uncharacterized protein n=1 Tax=Ixodes persulcatus TaxID=34615 RepID=A0AC60QXX1_IXOPE|nr:hypothetical protein HPB47_013674 [Ixodes persulcatus]
MLQLDGLRGLEDKTCVGRLEPIFPNDERKHIVVQNSGFDHTCNGTDGDLEKSCAGWEHGATSNNGQRGLGPGVEHTFRNK